MKIGLLALAQRGATDAAAATRAKASRVRRDRAIAAALMPILLEAVEIGLDQALIALREDDAAVLKIAARKAAIRQSDGGLTC